VSQLAVFFERARAALPLCPRCLGPPAHVQPAFRGEPAYYTCEAAGQPAAWRKAPHPADTACSWCKGGYLRLTDGSRVLHSLPEPAGMLACEDPRVVEG
jgi:hypothetical protein